jgi:hypothetical protein
MAHVVIESLVPIFIMLGMFLLIFGVVYIRSRENMALIDRGFNPRQEAPRPRYFNNLKYGLLLLGAGAGLITAYLIDVVVMGHKVLMDRGIDEGRVHWSTINDTREPIIYFALVAVGGGIGLYLAYKAERKEWKERQEKNVD